MDSPDWLQPPPPPTNKLPWFPVVRTPRTGLLRCVIVSATIAGCRLHRPQGKPILCPGVGCIVEGCPATGRWQGYLDVQIAPSWERRLLEITAEPWHQIEAIAEKYDGNIRGLEIKLERRGGAKNSPVFAEFIAHHGGTRQIPEARDVPAYVFRMYRKKE